MMRKFTLIALAFVLTVALAACGCRRYDPAEDTSGTSEPITIPTEDDMTMPSSNIPDPTVDSNSTAPTDGTDGTDNTDGTDSNTGILGTEETTTNE